MGVMTPYYNWAAYADSGFSGSVGPLSGGQVSVILISYGVATSATNQRGHVEIVEVFRIRGTVMGAGWGPLPAGFSASSDEHEITHEV